MEAPELGKLITNGERRRDAVHIAIAPVEAAIDGLEPGEDVKLVPGTIDKVTNYGAGSSIGIVDPFLPRVSLPWDGKLKRGDRFYVFLYPNTITSLRHIWTHPAFQVKIPSLSSEEKS